MQTFFKNDLPQFVEQFRQMDRALNDIRATRVTLDFGTQPMVFGGYLRNLFLNVPPVDMDVHITDQQWRMPNGWYKLKPSDMVERTGDEGFRARMSGDDEYEKMQRITSCGYFAVPGVDVPVNIVQSRRIMNATTVMEETDFFINQYVYVGQEAVLCRTNGAMADTETLTMTWIDTRGVENLPQARKRAERIVAHCAKHGVVLTADFSAIAPRT